LSLTRLLLGAASVSKSSASSQKTLKWRNRKQTTWWRCSSGCTRWWTENWARLRNSGKKTARICKTMQKCSMILQPKNL